MEKVEWGWVVMGKPKRMNAWLSKWGSHCSGVHVINNKAHDSFGIPGSNAYFEFSGYLEVLNCMKTEGPYVIANDTWFKTHNAYFWSGLLRNFRPKKGSATCSSHPCQRSQGRTTRGTHFRVRAPHQ